MLSLELQSDYYSHGWHIDNTSLPFLLQKAVDLTPLQNSHPKTVDIHLRTQLLAVLKGIWNWVERDVECRDKDPRPEEGMEWILIRRRNNHPKSNYRVRDVNMGLSRRNTNQDQAVLKEIPLIDLNLRGALNIIHLISFEYTILVNLLSLLVFHPRLFLFILVIRFQIVFPLQTSYFYPNQSNPIPLCPTNIQNPNTAITGYCSNSPVNTLPSQ